MAVSAQGQAVTVSTPPRAPEEARGRIQGTLFDSLLMRPVARATVMLMGTARTDTSDSRGRFSFDTVAAGTHEVGFSSIGLDSAGLGVMGVAVDVNSKEAAKVSIATPSLSTLWKNRFTDFTIASSYPVEHYRALELFSNPTQTPAEYYRFGEGCGTVLFWTRNSRW